MKREHGAIVAMGATLVGSQVAAILLSGIFSALRLQAFPEPQDPTNALVYIVMILIFTGVILALVKLRRRNFAKYVILGSVLLTLAFILFVPIYVSLVLLREDVFNTELGGNVSLLLSFVVAAGLTTLLVKHPEWYVVDAIGLIVAAGVTAIMGISFGIVPALLLLVGLAAYDAWAVYRTRHMVTLADELTSQRLPILLVIPKRADYSFRKQKSLKDEIARGEEREAMFIGLGDLIIPGVLSVSAFNFLPAPAGVTVALATLVGTVVGFAILMRFVLSGNPQAGLPLLNGGAITGFFVAHVAVYGSLTSGFL
ncbi:MAG: presenilin family intramembrane aspartyl protease PSH [Methanobacteriota archaeon]